jgi:hypothetical protein
MDRPCQIPWTQLWGRQSCHNRLFRRALARSVELVPRMHNSDQRLVVVRLQRLLVWNKFHTTSVAWNLFHAGQTRSQAQKRVSGLFFQGLIADPISHREVEDAVERILAEGPDRWPGTNRSGTRPELSHSGRRTRAAGLLLRRAKRPTGRAGHVVKLAQDWRWGSRKRWLDGPERDPHRLSPWPMARTPRWAARFQNTADRSGTEGGAQQCPPRLALSPRGSDAANLSNFTSIRPSGHGENPTISLGTWFLRTTPASPFLASGRAVNTMSVHPTRRLLLEERNEPRAH